MNAVKNHWSAVSRGRGVLDGGYRGEHGAAAAAAVGGGGSEGGGGEGGGGGLDIGAANVGTMNNANVGGMNNIDGGGSGGSGVGLLHGVGVVHGDVGTVSLGGGVWPGIDGAPVGNFVDAGTIAAAAAAVAAGVVGRGDYAMNSNISGGGAHGVIIGGVEVGGVHDSLAELRKHEAMSMVQSDGVGVAPAAPVVGGARAGAGPGVVGEGGVEDVGKARTEHPLDTARAHGDADLTAPAMGADGARTESGGSNRELVQIPVSAPAVLATPSGMQEQHSHLTLHQEQQHHHHDQQQHHNQIGQHELIHHNPAGQGQPQQPQQQHQHQHLQQPHDEQQQQHNERPHPQQQPQQDHFHVHHHHSGMDGSMTVGDSVTVSPGNVGGESMFGASHAELVRLELRETPLNVVMSGRGGGRVRHAKGRGVHGFHILLIS